MGGGRPEPPPTLILGKCVQNLTNILRDLITCLFGGLLKEKLRNLSTHQMNYAHFMHCSVRSYQEALLGEVDPSKPAHHNDGFKNCS